MTTFSVVATSQLLGGNCCRHFRQSSLLYREVAGLDKTLVPAYQNAQRYISEYSNRLCFKLQS